MTETSIVNVAVLSATYNIILQILVRILSSVSNAIIFRFIAREALGVINVRLLLLYSSCHCLSREAFRRSCLAKFEKESLRKKFNLLWMILPVCLVCSYILGYIWLYLLEVPKHDVVPNYSAGVYAVIVSVVIEILAEPLYVFSQCYYFVKLKVFVEGMMLTFRSLIMVILLSKWSHYSMTCFCISQISGSIVYTLSFYGYFAYYLNSPKAREVSLPITSLMDILPDFSKGFLNADDVYLTWSFFKQTLLKQLLTEGERYLMTFFSVISFAEQGLFDVVNNLGSMAARFIFLPIEDSTYLIFTQLLSRDKDAASQENVSTSQTVLRNVLRLLILLGLTILTFGYSYSQLLLFFYGGTKLSSGVGLTLMRWHCFYVLLIAINGVTEGFKFAVMDHTQINRYNRNLVFLSILFLSAAIILVNLFGSVGFIIANCFNMLIRITHSAHFIEHYFQVSKLWWSFTMPHQHIFLTLVAIMILTSISEIQFCCASFHLWIWHLLLGVVCFLAYSALLWFRERDLVVFLYRQWRKTEASDSKLKMS